MDGDGDTGDHRHHGHYNLELHCGYGWGRNHLEVRWLDDDDDNDNHSSGWSGRSSDNARGSSEHVFRLDDISLIVCGRDRGGAFNSHHGSGRGYLDGNSGATVEWTFTDGRGSADRQRVTLRVCDARGRVVLELSDALSSGANHAHGR